LCLLRPKILNVCPVEFHKRSKRTHAKLASTCGSAARVALDKKLKQRDKKFYWLTLLQRTVRGRLHAGVLLWWTSWEGTLLGKKVPPLFRGAITCGGPDRQGVETGAWSTVANPPEREPFQRSREPGRPKTSKAMYVVVSMFVGVARGVLGQERESRSKEGVGLQS